MNLNFDVLRKNPLFSDLSDENIQKGIAFFDGTAKNYKKGEYILNTGDDVKRFGILTAGFATVFFDDIGGERVTINSVGTGGSFGEALCFLKKTSSPVSVCASSDCTVLWCKIGKKEDSLGFMQRFTALLATRTLAINSRLQILSKLTIRDKLICFFSECVIEQHSRTFNLPFDREGLASYLGTNRSALSRELSKMKAEGIIDFYKNSFKIL